MQTHLRQEKILQRVNFLCPETAGWGGALPLEGVVIEKFLPSLESLLSLGFEGGNLGCPGNFAVPDPWGVQKVCGHFGGPYHSAKGTPAHTHTHTSAKRQILKYLKLSKPKQRKRGL